MSDKERRAEAAYRAILAHAQYNGSENGDRQDDLVDLLANLMHMHGEGQCDFNEALRIARGHYEVESGKRLVEKAKLYLCINGGILESVSSNEPHRFRDAEIIRVDYDVEGSDKEPATVMFYDGSHTPAFVDGFDVENTQIKKADPIVYIAESGDEYTMADMLEMTKGSQLLADVILEMCTWENPGTVLDQMLNEDLDDEGFKEQFPHVHKALVAVSNSD